LRAVREAFEEVVSWASGGHNAAHQLLDGLLRGAGVGASVAGLEPDSLALLAGSHAAAAAQLGLVEAVDVVRGADQEIEIEGPVVAGLQGAEAVEGQGLGGGGARPQVLVEEQAVAAQALDQALDGGMGHPELECDLAQAGAGEDAVVGGLQQLGVLEPVAGGEGL
jgi:hypothetical protein